MNAFSDVNQLKRALIQSLHDTAHLGAFNVELNDFKYYICLEDAISPPASLTLLDIPEVDLWNKSITGFDEKTIYFDVDQATTHVMIWAQPNNVRNDSIYSHALFRSPAPDNNGAVSEYQDIVRFKTLYMTDENTIRYPAKEFNFKPGAYKYNIQQLYDQNQIHLDLDFDSNQKNNNKESLEEFNALGKYWLTPVESLHNCNPRLQVNISFDQNQHDGDEIDLNNLTKSNLYLMAISRKLVQTIADDGCANRTTTVKR